MRLSIKYTVALSLWMLISFSATSALSQSNARSVWKNAIKKCAASDHDGRIKLGGKQVFLGVGNISGPGTIFRVFPEGDFTSSRKFANYTPDTRKNLIEVHREFSCGGSNDRSVNISPRVGLEVAVPVGGELGVETKRARNIKFFANKVRWDNLYIGEYEQMLLNYDGASTARADLTWIATGSRDFILTRALWVDGFVAVLEFDNSTGVDVKAKFPPQALTIPVPGQADIGLDLQWTGNTKLTIVSDAGFYIAGDLRRYSPPRVSTRIKRSETYGWSMEQLKARVFGERGTTQVGRQE